MRLTSTFLLLALGTLGLADELKVEKLTAKTCKRPSKKGDTLSMHYEGRLTNGEVFDGSRPRGEPFTFPLGQGRVIQGWDKGLEGMCIGEVWKLTIPHDLAYGERGFPPVIPPKSTLIFEVELLAIGGVTGEDAKSYDVKGKVEEAKDAAAEKAAAAGEAASSATEAAAEKAAQASKAAADAAAGAKDAAAEKAAQASAAAGDAAAAAGETVESATEAVKDAAGAATESVKSAASVASEKVESATEAAKDAAGSAGEKAAEATKKVKDEL